MTVLSLVYLTTADEQVLAWTYGRLTGSRSRSWGRRIRCGVLLVEDPREWGQHWKLKKRQLAFSRTRLILVNMTTVLGSGSCPWRHFIAF